MAALRTLLFIQFIVLIYLGVALAGNCPASTLASAPTYPAANAVLAASLTPAVTPANPLTTAHWSETAALASYRPPAPADIVANPAQANCPHLQPGLKNWHDASTWPSGSVPKSGEDVAIPAGLSVLVSSCSVAAGTVFGLVSVPAGSALVFDDADVSISATGFDVGGSLLAGSDTCRLRSKITITLHGTRGQKDPTLPYVKGISVTGTIDIHGAQYFPTWSRLAMTAKPGSTIIFIQDIVNWQPGQKIVITTTELKDARDWHRNEERTIVSVKRTTLDASVSAVELDSPLSYQHFGGREYQAEVSLLSRNIVIQGNIADSLPTDSTNYICTDPSDASTYPCQNSWLTGFGAHVIVSTATSKGRFSGVELLRVGQTNTLGRYPIHFHMIGNVTDQNYQNHYVRDCAVHDSYFRCYAIHGTSGVRLTQNTAYNVIGHCYFLEDGVEENNEISYNQAAHIHPLGPFQNPSIGGNGDNFWGQYLSYYSESTNLILPSDMSAGCFYITNTYNSIFGNAASGGWAGFAIPSLPLPVKLHQNIKDMVPANRPFLTPFRGNSAHSSGYWWQSAGSIYVGGELKHDTNGVLVYTAGRSTSRDTCSDKTRGSTPGDGCWDLPLQRWLDFQDNKVFLSNRGMQNWGNRANIVRLELHDVSLAMNIFGKVWIDSMLMECRTANNKFTFFNGCPKPPQEGGTDWGNCNVRDYTFFRNFGGFQWYDVGQQHILTDSTFRNCRADWERCSSGSSHKCSDMAVFTSLTHSDQFVPELMQVSRGVAYENVGDLWRYSTDRSDGTGITVSGRLQSWYDVDGSASQLGVRTMIGSSWANTWWKYNDNCQYYLEAYRCPLNTGDSAASVIMKLYNSAESSIGSTICMNGGDGSKKCPVLGQVSHFGSTNETAGLSFAVNAKLSGPLIASSGGWFIRYTAGTPKVLNFNSVQVAMLDTFLVALPYPAGTKFTIYHKAADWCGTSWAYCRKDYISVGSVAAVRAAFGDAYYWDENARTLYLRLVQPAGDTWGNPYDKTYNNSAPWQPVQPREQFTRAGLTLITSSYQTRIVIEATCASDPCAPQPTVRVPSALAVIPSTPAPTIKPTTTTAPTQKATTAPVVTPAPTSKPATTPAPTVKATTAPVATPAPTTKPATTPAPTTKPATTPAPTTKPATTPAPTTKPATTPAPTVKAGTTPAPTVKATVKPGTTPAPTVKATVKPTTKPQNVTVKTTVAFSVSVQNGSAINTTELKSAFASVLKVEPSDIKISIVAKNTTKRAVEYDVLVTIEMKVLSTSDLTALSSATLQTVQASLDDSGSPVRASLIRANAAVTSAASVDQVQADLPTDAPVVPGDDSIKDGAASLFPSFVLVALIALAFLA